MHKATLPYKHFTVVEMVFQTCACPRDVQYHTIHPALRDRCTRFPIPTGLLHIRMHISRLECVI